MIKNDDLRTSPKQRLIIIAIAVFMLLSTFALYAGIIVNYSDSGTADSKLTAEEQARYDELMAEYNKVDAQAKELSGKYFDKFKQYKSQVKAYNAADITTIKTKDLKVGTGKTVDSTDFVDYSAYYIGWLSDETVFDSSFDSYEKPTSLKTPLKGATSMIEGWKQGIKGMKIGGVRVISIPSAQAYGSEAQGNIPANSPLKFVIMLINPVKEIEVGEELLNLYYKSLGVDSSSSADSAESGTEEVTTEETTDNSKK